MTTLKIKVTKDIIAQSRFCNWDNAPTSCAVSLAIIDIFPHAWVGQSGLVFDHQGLTEPYNLEISFPKDVFNWIQVFDKLDPEERLKMQEIEFQIPIPDYVIEKINIDEIKPLLENHPTLELINN